MSIINSSYEALSDPERRADHDAWILREELRLAQHEPRQAGGAPVPPRWQQPESEATPTGAADRGMLARISKGLLSIVVALLNTFSHLIVTGLLLGAVLLLYWLVSKPTPPSAPSFTALSRSNAKLY